jgi:hypothetical protein
MAGIELKRRDGLREFADSVMQGAQAGQQYATNTLRQQGMKNELAEYDRQQQIRSGLAAIDPTDLEGQAKVLQGHGENERASALIERQRNTFRDQAWQAVQAGDLPTATELANKVYGTNYKFGGLSADKQSISLETLDPKTGAFRKVKPIPTSDFIAGLLGREKGADYAQKERAQSQSAALMRAMYGGGAGAKDRWEIAYLGDRTGKGQATPMQIQRTGQGIFGYDDATGKTRRLTNAEVALLRPDPGGTQGGYVGPATAAFNQMVKDKQYDNMGVANPEQFTAAQAKAFATDRMSLIQQSIRPGEQDPKVLMQLLAGNYATPAELIAAGAHPDAVQSAAQFAPTFAQNAQTATARKGQPPAIPGR